MEPDTIETPTKVRNEATIEQEKVQTILVTLQVSSGGVSKARTLNVPFVPPTTDLATLVITLGEKMVLDLALAAARQAVESEAKRLMRNRPNGVPLYTDKEILARMATYKIGTDGAQRDKTLAAIAQIPDPGIRKAALEAAGATESELPQPSAPKPQVKPAKAEKGPQKATKAQ